MLNVKTISFDLALVFLILLLIFVFSYIGETSLLIYIFSLLSIGLLVLSNERLYMLFILVFLSNGIIQKESYLINIIGIHQVLTIFTLVSLFKGKSFRNGILNVNERTGRRIIWFIFLYTAYAALKNTYFDIFGNSWVDSYLKSFNFLVMTFTLITIPRKIKDNVAFYNRVIIAALLFFAISALMSSYLTEFGLYTIVESSGSSERYYGFIGNGDSNTLATIMVIGIGVLLNNISMNRLKSISYVTIIICIAALGVSGSRNGLVALSVLLVVYFYSIRNKSNVYIKTIIIIILVSLSLPFLSTNISRLFDTGKEQQYVEGSTSNRVGKWVYYLSYFAEKPKSLLIGGSDRLEIGWDKSFQVAHNFFIQIVYNMGIFALFYFVYLIWMSIKLQKLLLENIIFLLLPLMLGIVFISDYGAILFYSIAISGLTPRMKNVLY